MDIDKREELINLYEKFGELLSQAQKQAFHLKYIEDLSLAEISKITATTRQAVNDAIKKAESKLLSISKKLA